jgi:hypothetical protein
MKDFPTQYNLCQEDALYFPHIPKTAGMTFRTILEDQFACDEICPATLKAQFAYITPEGLERYRLYRGHLSYIDIPRIVKKNLVLVTVLRDPVARVISHYEYIRRTPGDPHYEAVKDMTLEEFAQKLSVGRIGKNVQVYYIGKLAKYTLHKLPHDEIMAIAHQSLDRFAFVGILERFQDSLFLLSYIFGWKPILNSRKENVAGSPTDKLYGQIPDSTLEMLRESTRMDQVLYDYALGIFNQRFEAMQQDLLATYGAEFGLDPTQAPAQGIEPEIMRQMLEKHSAKRFRELHPHIDNTALYDFCQPLRGTGWQRRECPDADPAYRWIGPGTTATLELPISPDTKQDYLAEFRVICTWAVAADVLDSLTLTVNGQPVELSVLYRDPGVKLLQAKVLYTVVAESSPFALFKFETNRSAPFKAFNPLNTDPRTVALALNYVQLYPATEERQKSASLNLFEDESWAAIATFLDKLLQPDERVAAPLAFRARLLNPVDNCDRFRTSNETLDWVVLHKSMTDNISPLLFKLVMQGFGPVFANDVFIAFTQRRDIPRLSYTAPHVRSLYLGRVKAYVNFHFDRFLKPRLSRWFGWKGLDEKLAGILPSPPSVEPPPLEVEGDMEDSEDTSEDTSPQETVSNR